MECTGRRGGKLQVETFFVCIAIFEITPDLFFEKFSENVVLVSPDSVVFVFIRLCLCVCDCPPWLRRRI